MKDFRSESGNVLLEAVGFVSIALGLVFISSIQLFTVQKEQLDLLLLARNLTTSHINNPEANLNVQLDYWKNKTSFANKTINVQMTCTPDCSSSGSLFQITFTSDSNYLETFGVLSN